MTAMHTDVVYHRLAGFLKRNPNASDTLQGIAEWWVRLPVDWVGPVLDRLVLDGRLEKLKRADSTIYRAVPGRSIPVSAPLAVHRQRETRVGDTRSRQAG